MTTQDYAEAYEDDSENVRGWPQQDTQEPPIGSDVAYLRAEVAALKVDQAHTMSWYKTVCELLTEHTAQRDAALAALARVEGLATQWESLGPGHYEVAGQLLQAIDEVALEYPKGQVG
jgi:hypothetical protein